MPVENNVCRVGKDGTVEISEWYSNGVMAYLRDALPTDHPESIFGCLRRLGLKPEQYGYYQRCLLCGG